MSVEKYNEGTKGACQYCGLVKYKGQSLSAHEASCPKNAESSWVKRRRGKAFALYHQPSGGDAVILYIGCDASDALDTLLEYGKFNYAEVGSIKLTEAKK